MTDCDLMKPLILPFVSLALLLPSCGPQTDDPLESGFVGPDGKADSATDGTTDSSDNGGNDDVTTAQTWREVVPLPAGSCAQAYHLEFNGPPAEPSPDFEFSPAHGADARRDLPAELQVTVDTIAHESSRPMELIERRAKDNGTPDLTLPSWDDTLPLFDRARVWVEPTRCYETPLGALQLTEALAYELYVEIAETTTGSSVDTTPGVRTVVGVRGAYPGTFDWHGNEPNRWNDTLALLWIDDDGQPRVLEFPATTEPGAHDFGYHNSSALRPNRRYTYRNGQHNSYDALRIAEEGYQVRDDTNNNGHWDSDRNGWLPPTGSEDHDRVGSLHNIHGNGVDPGVSFGEAPVHRNSAGCQVIPGTTNYMQFITTAWTARGDEVQYFLVDVRDVAPDVWHPCQPDGSHACPFRIDRFPFSETGDTEQSVDSAFDLYNCASSNESGPEDVYVFTTDVEGTLSVQVSCESGVDVDIQLLEGDDENACLNRHDADVSHHVHPGRYLIVVDSFVNGSGSVLSGPYELRVDFY